MRRTLATALLAAAALAGCGSSSSPPPVLVKDAQAPVGPRAVDPPPPHRVSAVAASLGSVTDRLTADKSAVEVTFVPSGTARLHVAYMQTLQGGGLHYTDVAATTKTYKPPAGYPVVDMIAQSPTGSNIGRWAGRLQTVPGSSPPPPPPPPPPSTMRVGVDIGGGTWAAALASAAGAVHYVRSGYQHFNSDTAMSQLAADGLTLLPLVGEGGGSVKAFDTSTYVSAGVTWFKRYGHGGTFWAGRPVDLGATTWEVVNEPGNPYFYGDCCSQAGHEAYADTTRKVKAAIEAQFPSGNRPKVLVSYDGGYNGSTYGEAIFAAGAVADEVTVHPYGGHVTRTMSAAGNRSRVEQAHAKTGKPVAVTEVGWPTCGETGDSLNWSETEQATNITNFAGWARNLGYVTYFVNFNREDYTGNCYGIDRKATTVQHKPAYTALREAAAH